MTLVNTATGEVIEFDKAAAEQRAGRIRVRLDSVADSHESNLDRFRRVLAEIKQSVEEHGDHDALGYRSHTEYVKDRFGGALDRLGVEYRQEAVGVLSSMRMSTRAIASVTGASKGTVYNDQRAGAQSWAPAPVSEPATNRLGADPQGEDAPEPASESPTVEPASPRPAVVGIDGKTYTRPTPVPAPKFERSPEQRNAEENSQSLASSLIFLLAFQHPNQRDHARIEWKAGREAVAPTNREYVTPNHMRTVAHGLLDLADEWENHS